MSALTFHKSNYISIALYLPVYLTVNNLDISASQSHYTCEIKGYSSSRQTLLYLSKSLKPIDFPAFPAGLLPYKAPFSLVFALAGQNKGNFLSVAACYLIQQAGRGAFRFPCRVSVDVHGGTDVGVSQKLLHVLRRCPIREQVTRERMSELMEVEALKSLNLL